MSPPGHPARTLRSVRRHLPYRAWRPLEDLRAATASTSPELVIASDARAVHHLHQLHAEEITLGDPSGTAALIERSLGNPASFATLQSQASLLQLARSLALCAPETHLLRGPADLAAWRDLHPFPWVFKVDGVSPTARPHIVRSWEQALHALSSLQQPLSTSSALRRLCEHDFFALAKLDRARPEILVQNFVPGSPATAMVACRNGEIVAGLAVEVLSTQPADGTVTVVRTLHSPAIAHAARVLIKHLGLSGFCGMDFILGRDTDDAYLVAVHPHATQLGHLRLGGQPDLASTLLIPPDAAPTPAIGTPASSTGQSAPQTIALFPQAWLANPRDPLLASPAVRHDIPWGEPALQRDLYKVPWGQRQRSAHLFELASRLLSRKKIVHELAESTASGK